MENNQRSEEWFNQRLGRFTASEMIKLMGIKALGLTGDTYALSKAIEQLYGAPDDNYVSYDMERGITLEPLAFKKFKEIKSLEFLDVKNCGFFEYGLDAGASPDGFVGTDAILEIKCPNESTFFKLIATNVIDEKYLYQMQMQMLATNRQKAYFFNYFVKDGEEMWHTIEVLRDENIISKIKERIFEATTIKNAYISKILNNKQF